MYQPKPIDTSHIQLADSITELIERLAENNHDIWAAQRMREGWTYAERRDDAKKQHPDLVAFGQLAESEKEYDQLTAVATIKAIYSLGYRVEPGPKRE